MTHRSDRVKLGADKARCEPAACNRKETCARYMAAFPAHGASVTDFSKSPMGLWCMSFIGLQQAAATVVKAPEVKGWIGSGTP
jgi:hypothetical protein